MREIAALLAAVLALTGLTACGDDGAEPGAPESATLVLDFTPNAVHSGIYAALSRGFYSNAGVELTIREPGESADAPKLLEAGRTEFAILDIHDLGIAREQGLDIVGVLPIVQRPLASLLVRADGPVRRPRDLEGRLAGVTGLPSDEAVLASVVAGDGGDPSAVEQVTIGFNAVASLAAGRVDAATGFWNAEGVALHRAGVPVRVFRVERFGAPAYPELVLCVSAATLRDDRPLVGAVVEATRRGYRFAASRPEEALGDLIREVPGLEPAEQDAQLATLGQALAPAGFDQPTLRAWAAWDLRHGILSQPVDIGSAFEQLGD
jgi:NitT/TauT family transport system substrate-binding protein/putative hydroxymethylpyrimidine transport system substrate-binding protein